MAAVSTPDKRLFLRNIYWSTEDSGTSLLKALKTFARDHFARVKFGKVLVGTSGNGHSDNWEMLNGLNPQEVNRLISEVIDRYYEAQEELVDEQDITSPTDLQIFNEMMDKLRPIYTLRQDFDGLRCLQSEETD